MDRSQSPVSEPDRPTDPPADRPVDRYGGGDPAPVARFADEPAARSDALREADRNGEIDPADRTAFRIGANLLTLVALVLGGWWLWRHVLAPALLGPG